MKNHLALKVVTFAMLLFFISAFHMLFAKSVSARVRAADAASASKSVTAKSGMSAHSPHGTSIRSSNRTQARTKNRTQRRLPASTKATSAASAFAGVGPQAVIMTIGGNRSNEATASAPLLAELRSMRSAFENGKYAACLTEAPRAKKVAKSLEPWIVGLELRCAMKIVNPKKADADRLLQVLNGVDAKAAWLATGAWASRLKELYLEGRLLALEWDSKLSRARAWQHLEHINAVGISGFDEAERAKLWRLAGELAFVQQKTEAARDYFHRSLAEQEQADLRERLRGLDASVPPDYAVNGPQLVQPRQPEGSEAELELFARINQLLKSGDLVPAVADAVKLLREYPGSSRGRWASDRAIETLTSVVDKASDKFIPVRISLLKEMSKADSERTGEWIRVLYNRGYWEEAAELSRATALGAVASRSTKNLEMALDALYAVEDWAAMKAVAEVLVEKHSGTAASRTALFRLGLQAYREGDDSRATQALERVLTTATGEGLEIQSRYWLWRALLRLKNEKAQSQADELMRRYPFSYYGLRARLETSGGKLEWTKDTPRLEVKVWLTAEERVAWERAQTLIAVGWFDEAQDELKILPPPITPEAKAIRATILASVKSFPSAARMANQAWDTKFELRRMDVMRATFPDEYRTLFESAAKIKGIDPLLTRSLTKQESGFNVRAVSTSNAMGLMQMIPPTAKEIADDLKLGKLNFPEDMFDAGRNIPMGTHYLAKMLNKFKGHVPLALAAYNAGPGRLDRWLNVRSSLRGLETTRTSAPEFEIWIDELPYSETSSYVKSILRNLLLYRVIEEGSIIAEEPLWKSVPGTARP